MFVFLLFVAARSSAVAKRHKQREHTSPVPLQLAWLLPVAMLLLSVTNGYIATVSFFHVYQHVLQHDDDDNARLLERACHLLSASSQTATVAATYIALALVSANVFYDSSSGSW
jgi:hypothetical protein